MPGNASAEGGFGLGAGEAFGGDGSPPGSDLGSSNFGGAAGYGGLSDSALGSLGIADLGSEIGFGLFDSDRPNGLSSQSNNAEAVALVADIQETMLEALPHQTPEIETGRKAAGLLGFLAGAFADALDEDGFTERDFRSNVIEGMLNVIDPTGITAGNLKDNIDSLVAPDDFGDFFSRPGTIPIIIDLSENNSADILTQSSSEVYFDIDNDGYLEQPPGSPPTTPSWSSISPQTAARAQTASSTSLTRSRLATGRLRTTPTSKP